jgi:arylsulfatase A-like enzyme
MDTRRLCFIFNIIVAGMLAPGLDGFAAAREATDRPNFVVIFTDDQGYGDLSCYGSTVVETPNIDRVAREGARLTSFYVAAPLCTPSRAALMTGCYPKRVSMAYGTDFAVLLAGDRKGLHPDEITIAELLRPRGYATGCFGKWHLGDQSPFLPTRQGFDEYFGIPYSHDIHPYHPRQDHFNFPPLPLLDGEQVIEVDPDADFLTERITQRATSFIRQHKDEPFFLYVPHPIPHKPLHVSPPFGVDVPTAIKEKLAEEKGIDYPTRDKLFPQAIAEIDASVGRIVEALEQNELERNTLLIFTSDNGPAVGSSGPLRGRKGSAYEGGMREPTVAWWPGQIEPGTDSDALLTAMDLLPTFARLAGTKAPDDRVIDGRDIWPALSGQAGAVSPHEYFFYHQGNFLRAVRSGPWKLVLPTAARASSRAGRNQGPSLYNLESDIGEKLDVAAGHPEVVGRLLTRAKAFEKELGAGNTLSPQCRPAGDVKNARPLVPHP